MATYTHDIEVGFGDTDSAGIVFYPRYFEMVNRLVEAWFAQGLAYPYRTMHLENHHGVPAVSLEAAFPAPSRIGDVLCFTLAVSRLSRKSATLHIEARCGEELRMTCRKVIVHSAVRPFLAAAPWPDAVYARMVAYLETEHDA